MSLTTSEMTPADIRACTCDSNNGGLGMGGDWLIAIVILFLFPMMFGGGMFGWGGGFGGGWGGNNAGMHGALTRADLCSEFNFNGLENSVRGVQQGICDSTYAFNTAVLNGFHGVDNAVCTLGYQAQQGFSQAELSRCNQQAALMQQLYQMGYNQQDCCCRTQNAIERTNYDAAMRGNETNRLIDRGFCDTNYNAATNTTAIIQNAHNDTDRVIAKLDAMEMARKDETIADLRTKLAACGDQTTAQYIINQLSHVINPPAVPAYPAASPCGLGNWSPQVLANGYNCKNGCGCTCNG